MPTLMMITHIFLLIIYLQLVDQSPPLPSNYLSNTSYPQVRPHPLVMTRVQALVSTTPMRPLHHNQYIYQQQLQHSNLTTHAGNNYTHYNETQDDKPTMVVLQATTTTTTTTTTTRFKLIKMKSKGTSNLSSSSSSSSSSSLTILHGRKMLLGNDPHAHAHPHHHHYHHESRIHWLHAAIGDRIMKKKKLVQIEKRMGSRPPMCGNKCNACNPCIAIQVPTPFSNNPLSSSSSPNKRSSSSNNINLRSSSTPSNFISKRSSSSTTLMSESNVDHTDLDQTSHRMEEDVPHVHLDYSNYQPEGWKCKCGNLIYNP